MPYSSFPLQVSPTIPEGLRRLADLAENFWFSWYPETGQLFRKLDAVLWRKVEGNPKLFLRCVDQGILDRAGADRAYLDEYDEVIAAFDAYLRAPGAAKLADIAPDDLVAYFCAEFGLHESFPIYSGGLGVLAGDHCKTASDLKLPFVAVGLLYRQGYFNQRIDRNGQQIPEYMPIDPRSTALTVAVDGAGRELRVTCPFPGRDVALRVWRAPVGRVSVLLLDTDVEENAAEDRRITHVLYGGDREHRLRQEAVLGIGGVRAVRALGLAPTVWHINEGHAAFSLIERLREFTARGLPFPAALETTAASTVFTTHTPVSAGHDVFHRDLVARQFESYPAALGVTMDEMLDLGCAPEQRDSFNMTRLALSAAASVNGVSKIHGGVSAHLCAPVWPDVPANENPVGYVTNGVHVPTFLRAAWTALLDRHLSPDWRDRIMDRDLLAKILEIPDEQFWQTNQKVKSQMLRVVRERLERQHKRNGLSEAHIHRLLKQVDPSDPNVLTIGFARRFATYKRATLLMTDLRWLEQLVRIEGRPVLFLFAGKAHPADEPAQWMIREIQRISTQPPFIGKILLLEGYDMGISRLLVSGVDIWLNTPVPPFEASGTSGMKAAINGTVNLSVLDGWWAEAYDARRERKNGWGIPPTVDTQDAADRDRQDATTLYEILQDEVIPLYYARDAKLGFSPEWVALCKRSMASILPAFNSERVLRDYWQCFYAPASRQGRTISTGDFAIARDLAAWKAKVRAAWSGVEIKRSGAAPTQAQFRDTVSLEVEVVLNGLSPRDVRVECVLRRALASELEVPTPSFASDKRPRRGVNFIDDEGVLLERFEPVGQSDGPVSRYRLDFRPPWAGSLLYEIRALPEHPHLTHPYELGLMRRL
jgi:glycogen phosphorylase